MKQVALFDIDGTIFRSSLMLEHLKMLWKYELLPSSVYINQLQDVERKWEARRIDYDTYMDVAVSIYNNALSGLHEDDVEFSARQVIKQLSHKIYLVAKSKIKWHKEMGHHVIFISGSPSFLVEKLAKILNVDEYYSTIYQLKRNKYTGEVEKPMWDSVSKNSQIDEIVSTHQFDMKSSYAYGDTQGDYLMLSRVGNPVAINPNKKLLTKLIKSPFKEKVVIFVERKNLIYTLDIDNVVIDGHKLTKESSDLIENDA